MSKRVKTIVWKTVHHIKFSDLDLFGHMGTGRYASYFVGHRMQSLATDIGWDIEKLEDVGFMMWMRRIEIDFLRPVHANQSVINVCRPGIPRALMRGLHVLWLTPLIEFYLLLHDCYLY
ncbi:thioesterase family protein [Streptomyces sp900105245]|uniref:Thioesterase family protein n=1 Tax=Streptomyces sp. 900105245 TaxID=3154379 RepID=A0ABV1ULL7_9ACTN